MGLTAVVFGPLMHTHTPSESSSKPLVVYIGIEWNQLPESFAPEMKLKVKAGVTAAIEELIALGYNAVWCGVSMNPDDAVATVSAALRDRPVGCVLLGAGLRKTDEALVLFERIVNEVHAACPHATICFNSTPTDSAAAVQRWLKP